jgi:hypothetical protein
MNLDIDEKNKRHQAAGDMELPEWAGRVVRYLYLGLSLALLASSLTLMSCASAGAADGLNWQDATQVISEQRALEIVGENSSVSGEDQQSILESMQVYQSDDGLLVVDFNSPLLSGRLGSLYVIYEADGKQIFNRYISKNLPEDVPVIQFSPDREGTDYPCLLISLLDEPTDPESGIAQVTLCYDGADWIETNTEVVTDL